MKCAAWVALHIEQSVTAVTSSRKGACNVVWCECERRRKDKHETPHTSTGRHLRDAWLEADKGTFAVTEAIKAGMIGVGF